MKKSTIDGIPPAISIQKAKSFDRGKALHNVDDRGAFGSKDMSLVEALTAMQRDYSLAVDEIDRLKQKHFKMSRDYELLRLRYESQKAKMSDLVWTYVLAADHLHIPPMKPNDFPETESRVGQYDILGDIGKGQLANVKSCRVAEDPKVEYAIKTINKDKVDSIGGLRRISDEIFALQSLAGEHVANVKDILHTESKLYIILEKGSMDLYVFIDNYPAGVPEDIAKNIGFQLLRALNFCHERFYCHRDIKPENVLISYTPLTKDYKVSLCDFDLCSKFDPSVKLSQFVGSPGFYEPEMVLKGSYFGDKADLWSAGCVFLEMIFGHCTFANIWMVAYDNHKQQSLFAEGLSRALEGLSTRLQQSPPLNHFITSLLKIDSLDRISMHEALHHSWFHANGFCTPTRLSPVDERLSPVDKLSPHPPVHLPKLVKASGSCATRILHTHC